MQMKTPLRVLVVEDSEDDTLLMVRQLQRDGYNPTFQRVETRDQMAAALVEQGWDVVLADYNMPRFSALEALELLKESGLDLPLIIVSGSIGEETAVAAMKAGARDYVMKDRMNRLATSVESALRDAEVRRQREQAERALQESDRRYRFLYDRSPSINLIIDMDGNVTDVNEAALEQLGYSRNEVVGKHLQDLIVPEQREEATSLIRQDLKGEHTPDTEISVYGKDGAIHTILISPGQAVLYADGQPIGILVTGTDISERKRMQEQIMLADRLASIGELASGLAHEINNPLTSVIGFAQLVSSKEVPCDIKEDIEIIHSEAQRCAEIVKKLLVFARKHTPAMQPMDVNETIVKTLELRVYEQKTNNIQVYSRLAPDLPMVTADYFQLQQVFLNIIINAEYFMTEAHGRGTLTVTTERVGDFVRVCFADDGPGIAPEYLRHVFDPFFTTKEVSKGTGLGLSICHGIVKECGGSICVESELGKGATFTVELPITVEEKQMEVSESSADEAQKAAKAKVLVIDDEPAIRQYLSRMLTAEGHEVETVDNGRDALEKLKSNRYGVVLLDIKMPGMSGIELYEHVQNMDHFLADRVLFITGDVIGVGVRDFLAKTKASYVTKPLDNRKLMKEINRILVKKDTKS
jgi:PAS domain S-box-containing protein